MGNKISKYSMFNPFYKKINKSDDVDKNKEDDKILKHNDDAILPIEDQAQNKKDEDIIKKEDNLKSKLKFNPEKYDNKKKNSPKIKKSELEKLPFFQYIPEDILKYMLKKPKDEKGEIIEGEDEIYEDEIVYNIDELPIQQGDYVVCEDFDDLSDKQIEFLRSKEYHRVMNVTSKKSLYYTTGEPYINLGYGIPFKMKRFKLVDRNLKNKNKILFLQFDLNIDPHGNKDEHNIFRGKEKMSDLFQELFNEKLKTPIVDFFQYEDIYRVNNEFYLDSLKIRDYDFVFFGFMSNYTTLVKMLISYLDKHNIPYLKYGTYKDYDNKAYEMHLVQSLGYPYIPSIMTTRLSKKIIHIVKEFGFPIIVKDVSLNRGEGVWKINNMNELIKKFTMGNNLMLIQKFIPNDGDYRVISIKNKVELVIKKERIEGTDEFRANVARGGRAIKGTLPFDIIKMCEDISKHLVCDIVGFDIIQDKDTGEYYVMETNSAPHFPTFCVISEINIPEIITDYIIRKINKY